MKKAELGSTALLAIAGVLMLVIGILMFNAHSRVVNLHSMSTEGEAARHMRTQLDFADVQGRHPVIATFTQSRLNGQDNQKLSITMLQISLLSAALAIVLASSTLFLRRRTDQLLRREQLKSEYRERIAATSE